VYGATRRTFVGKKPGADPKFEAWHARFGIFLKLAGPVLMILGLVYFMMDAGRR
jgi:hypothetical protein